MAKFQFILLYFAYLVSPSQSFCNLPENDPIRNINRVQLVKNGYEGLLIAIDPKLGEDPRVIDGLKVIF